IRLIINSLCITALLVSLKAVATDDAYLKMLEGEAEEASLDKSGQLKDAEPINKNSTDGITKTNWTWEGDLEGDALPPSLAQDEFATVLKQHFYGSFVFYRKLNSIDQQTVYYHYTKSSSADLDSIRQDILDHLKR
ncbi:MAG: hypothetical protein KAJ32_01900, partial [Gammaproteobacteria bacterium]|nr:hypothetical protein [Gammaproteobacteria bacterium]